MLMMVLLCWKNVYWLICVDVMSFVCCNVVRCVEMVDCDSL